MRGGRGLGLLVAFCKSMGIRYGLHRGVGKEEGGNDGHAPLLGSRSTGMTELRQAARA